MSNQPEEEEAMASWPWSEMDKLNNRAEASEAALAAASGRAAGLEAALRQIAGQHIPDQPAAYGGDELNWAQHQYAELRKIAQAALSARPDAPDVRVVTVAQLERLSLGTDAEAMRNEIRAIIGEPKE